MNKLRGKFDENLNLIVPFDKPRRRYRRTKVRKYNVMAVSRIVDLAVVKKAFRLLAAAFPTALDAAASSGR
uniref:Uncharacterized protein n=1 Tax=Agrobacterium albertimagni TaxID=147266 RepID=A0A7C1NRL8_9HYPH